MFQLSTSATSTDTTLRGFLLVAPRHLVDRFGRPIKPSADGKVSGSYVFVTNTGGTAVVYDWKSTALYSAQPEANLPSSREFWESPEPSEFSVSARGPFDLSAFAPWLGARGFRIEWKTPWTYLVVLNPGDV